MATYPFTSALVTGASSGIGEELTRQLAAAGVTVVVVARRVDRLEALAGELDGIEVLAADLGTRAGQDLVAARIADADRPDRPRRQQRRLRHDGDVPRRSTSTG